MEIRKRCIISGTQKEERNWTAKEKLWTSFHGSTLLQWLLKPNATFQKWFHGYHFFEIVMFAFFMDRIRGCFKVECFKVLSYQALHYFLKHLAIITRTWLTHSDFVQYLKYQYLQHESDFQTSEMQQTSYNSYVWWKYYCSQQWSLFLLYLIRLFWIK